MTNSQKINYLLFLFLFIKTRNRQFCMKNNNQIQELLPKANPQSSTIQTERFEEQLQAIRFKRQVSRSNLEKAQARYNSMKHENKNNYAGAAGKAPMVSTFDQSTIRNTEGVRADEQDQEDSNNDKAVPTIQTKKIINGNIPVSRKKPAVSPGAVHPDSMATGARDHQQQLVRAASGKRGEPQNLAQVQFQQNSQLNNQLPSRNTGTAQFGQKPTILNSQTIQTIQQSTHENNSEQNSIKEKSIGMQESRVKSRGRLQVILSENSERQAEQHAGRTELQRSSKLQNSKMGMTFGGEDGFYKIPQRISSQTVDCEWNKPESKQRRIKRSKNYSKNSPPAKAEDVNGKGPNRNGLEVIYENDFATSTQQVPYQQQGRNDCDQADIVNKKYTSQKVDYKQQTRKDSQGEHGKFKQNMLLGFYDWPKIETSAVFTASVKNSIQSDNINSATAAPSILGMQDSINASCLKEASACGQATGQANQSRPQQCKGQRKQRQAGANAQQQQASKMQLSDVIFNEINDRKKNGTVERKMPNAGRREDAVGLAAPALVEHDESGAKQLNPSSSQNHLRKNADIAARKNDFSGYTVPFLKEIENLQNYQNLKNQSTNSRKRLITVRKAESKAVTHSQRQYDLRIEKPTQKSNRMSPDTPSQNPFSSELRRQSGKVGGLTKQQRRSQDSDRDIDSPTFVDVYTKNQQNLENLNIVGQIGKSQKLQLPIFGAKRDQLDNVKEDQDDHDAEDKATIGSGPKRHFDSVENPPGIPVSEDIYSSTQKRTQQFKLPINANTRNLDSKEELERRQTDKSQTGSISKVEQLSFVKLEIGGPATNQRDIIYNQRSSSMAHIEPVPQQKLENDRPLWRPDNADVTKKSTPELCPSKGKPSAEIHAQTQQRISSQSQATVLKSQYSGSHSNTQFKAIPSAVSNTRSLQRHAMNDTFSEDAWRKLNTMKLQRQQQQALGHNSKFKVPQLNPAGVAHNLNIVNQRQQTQVGSVKPQINAKASLIDERHFECRGESSQGQRLNEMKAQSLERDEPMTALKSFQSHQKGQNDGESDGHCFSQLTRKQIALKNQSHIPNVTEGHLSERLNQGSIDEPSLQSREQSLSVFPDSHQQSHCQGPNSGSDMINTRSRQMDVAKKVRKSYEQFANKERRKDGGEGLGQQEREPLQAQHAPKNESLLMHQQNSRYLSVGFATQHSNQMKSNGSSKKVHSGREASSKFKVKSDFDNMKPSDFNTTGGERNQYGKSFERKDAIEPARMSSCAGDNMKQSLNSVVSTAFGDTTTSGNGGTFKKSDASSFTQISSEFQATKNSNENEKENNQCLMNQQQIQNGLDCNDYISNHNGPSKQTKQIFSKQVKTNRIGADHEQKRRQFSLSNKYATCIQNEKSITVRQSMNSKRSTELFNQKTMSTAGTDGPFVPQPQLCQQKEKLILPTINTSRKLQIVDVLSFANMAVSNNSTHSNLLNLPLKSSENPQMSRFSAGSGSLINGKIPEGEANKADQNSAECCNTNFNSSSAIANALTNENLSNPALNFHTTFNNGGTHQASQSISALKSFYKGAKEPQPHGMLAGEERGAKGSSTVQAISGENCGPGAAPETLHDIAGGRSLSFRQQIQGSRCGGNQERGKHTSHASVTSAGHLILQQPQLADAMPPNHCKTLRQSMHNLNQNGCSSTKNAQNQNGFSSQQNQGPGPNPLSNSRTPINMIGLSKRQQKRGASGAPAGSAQFTADRE